MTPRTTLLLLATSLTAAAWAASAGRDATAAASTAAQRGHERTRDQATPALAVAPAGGALTPAAPAVPTRGTGGATAQVLPIDCTSPSTLPPGIERIANVPYGLDSRQRFDVYRPTAAASAPRPVILMVHGGGWANGDKAMLNVVANKVARWVPKGWLLVSVNYRMLPDTPPLEQARDVARALATAQQLAPQWGGDPTRFVLMGHSAGAHLVTLLDADTTLATGLGALPWRAVIALDSAAYDVPRLMRAPHLPLYDDAFGTDPAAWPIPSPIDRLHAGGARLFGVCSSLRTDSCPQAADFAVQADAVGTPMQVYPVALTHEQVNECLGLPSDYTRAVDHVLSSAVLVRP